VVAWLLEFGLQGRRVAPLVAGSLIGLQHQDAAPPQMPMAKQTSTTDLLVTDLAAMSYPVKEAKGWSTGRRLISGLILPRKRRCAIVLQQAEKEASHE